MENKQLQKRLHKIEEELLVLREDLEPSAENKWKRSLKRTSKFLISYWPLVSLAFAIAIAIIAEIFYGVGPFESYRAIKTTRELSKFYSELGDNLLFRAEWEAAEVAYRTALEIDKNNTQATYGIFKAQVFQPLEGQKFYAPEVADAKLDYLEDKIGDDYQTKFLRGVYHFSLQHYEEAFDWLSQAIASNPDFAAGYLQRGYVQQSNSDIQGACQDYHAALEADLKKNNVNSIANNNVGYCDLLEQNFDDAIQHLKIAQYNSPKLVTYINLGDAYLFAGKIEDALAVQLDALRSIEDAGEGIENERYVAGEWTYNFMPPYVNDKITMNSSVKVFDITQKKIFMHYNLSFGYALNHYFDAATSEFNEANRLDTHKYYTTFFASKMQSIRHFVKMNGDVQRWFEMHEEILEPN